MGCSVLLAVSTSAERTTVINAMDDPAVGSGWAGGAYRLPMSASPPAALRAYRVLIAFSVTSTDCIAVYVRIPSHWWCRLAVDRINLTVRSEVLSMR